MTTRISRRPAIDPADLAMVAEATELIRSADLTDVLTELLPAVASAERADLAAHCTLIHAAVAVFTRSPDRLPEALRSWGLPVGEPAPSVVVRQRLAERYGLDPARLEVDILRAPVAAADGSARELEIFAVAVPAGSGLDRVAERERAEANEAHLALRVTRPDGVVLHGLRALLVDRGELLPDGGGYNAHEDGTVLYFRSGAPGPGAGERGRRRRLELHARGCHPAVLAAHLRARAPEPERRLLELMTGAWTTQTIATAAALGIVDALPPGDGPALHATELAHRTGTDPDALGRLLRHLAALRIAAAEPAPVPAPEDGAAAPEEQTAVPDTGTPAYRLGPLGVPLRADAAHSLRPLALLYGGPFYRSFGELAYSVRTGQEAFQHVFGQGHFEHFAQDTTLAALFDGAMAASAPMFAPVAEAVAASGARTVVDVAGGDGALLARVLTAAPHARGVLLEREHAAAAARDRLAAAGLLDRCEVVVGDFTRAVPGGGDSYLLSRVLHDWDDARCVEILRRCVAAMPEHAELLLVERLLPEEDGAAPDQGVSLAVAWDVHMLCNVGGRERTADHYRRLLAAAGLSLVAVSPLPLDGFLLRARRGPDDGDLATAAGDGDPATAAA
ncbi:methyltransferase [Kitasatospora sp. GAS1066B]|uniref:methyltransferase n=1 Tax=Kitasatospora sp. GAS1066B TaxID=3156271 RepID=UPI003519AFBD